MSVMVDHYLLQLKSFLPAKQRDDIAAEIDESIRSAVDARERELGRKLADNELTALLKGFGHPLLVAGRYLPMQHLIGPEVFPLYWYVLQAVLIVIGVIAGLLAGVALLVAPGSLQAAMRVLTTFFWIGLNAAAITTLVFAILDHQRVRFAFLETFDPRKVDAGIWGVRASALSPISRSDTVFELATLVIFLCWWVGWLVFPNEIRGVAITLSGAAETFYYPLIALCAIDLTRLAVDLVRPYRTGLRVALRLSLNVAWLATFALAYRAEGLLEAAQIGAAAGDVDGVLTLAQRGLNIVLIGLAAVTAVLIATDVVRLLRR